jgi:hypothetical protein
MQDPEAFDFAGAFFVLDFWMLTTENTFGSATTSNE